MSPGNDSVPEKKLIFKTTVSILDSSVFQGYLSSISDSTIIASRDQIYAGIRSNSSTGKLFHYSNVDQISFRRKGSTGRGVLIGAVSGLVIGTIIGYASYQEPPHEPDALFYFDFGPGVDAAAGGTVGMLSGAVIGGLIGHFASKTFVIKGKKEKLRDARTYIEARLNRTRN